MRELRFGFLPLLLLLMFGGAGCVHSSIPVASTTKIPATLIVEPNDGMAPIDAAVLGAKKTIDLVMYELADHQFETELIAAKKRGVNVDVLLCGSWAQSINQPATELLQSAGVSVHWSSDAFALTHQKTLIVDGRVAYIMTFNLVSHDYPTSRDFAFVDRDPTDVNAIEKTFAADWRGQTVTPSDGTDLVWSPGSEPKLLSLINHATISLDVYNEEMNDWTITNALSAAARRGVNVRIDMTDDPTEHAAFQSLSAAGVHVRTYAADAKLYIHAKIILADQTQAFLGSENFSYASLFENRELGVIISNPSILTSLGQTFDRDWQHATPMVYAEGH